MTPEAAIAALDRALVVAGLDCTLRRIYGQAGSTQTNSDVTVRAIVRSFQPQELAAGIAQGNVKAILSPTEISQSGWPYSEAASATLPDPSMPRRNDRLIADGRSYTVEAVNPISMGNKLVRIELGLLG
jgi:hypothetical protein